MKMLENELQNLKEKFPDMPEACHQGLMDAARSVKEEEKMKKFTMRTVLVTALILALTAAVALAAGQLGLKDLLGDHGSYALPTAAQEIMENSEKKTFTLGPVSVTLEETLADGYLIYANTLVTAKEPSVLFTWGCDPTDYIYPELAAALGLEGRISYLDAAKQLKLPLYRISSWLEYDYQYQDGEEMSAEVYGENGEVLCVFMAQTDPEKMPEILDGTLHIRVEQWDLDAGESMTGKEWSREEKLSIPVQGVTAEKKYAWEGKGKLGEFTLTEVIAQKTCAGVYYTAVFKADDGANRDAAHALYNALNWMDMEGNAFPAGVSFSGEFDLEAWPRVTLGGMWGIDDLPDSMKLKIGEYEMELK